MANKFFLYQYELGDIITFKKQHPCGNKEWIATRVGAQIKVKCMKCGREVELKREDIERSTVAVRKADGT